MRQVIASASVGDDIYGDDPSANALSEYSAKLVGKENALYTSSGTMANLIAFLAIGRPGESLLAGKSSHIWYSEAGSFSAVAGLCPYPLDDDCGIPKVEDIEKTSRISGNIHQPQTTILALENTHNYAGGIATAPADFAEVAREGKRLGLHVHLDGARIFNASTLHSVDVKEYTKEVDSIQFCLSKGLGAPMGSMLCGTSEFIANAKKWRKRLGGAQRQVGIAAAAGLFALQNNIQRLNDDHKNAKTLFELLAEKGIEVERVENMTNMIFFRLPKNRLSSDEFIFKCSQKGLLLNAMSKDRIRLVTHLDVNEEDVEIASSIIAGVLSI
jgi:threonine aldolase